MLWNNKTTTIIGDEFKDLVFKTRNKIYIKMGDKYYPLSFEDQTSQTKDINPILILETKKELDELEYPGDKIAILILETGEIFTTFNGEYKIFNITISEENILNVNTINGQLKINTDLAPFIISSKKLVKNLNAEYLNGYSSEDFAIKIKDEIITGKWKFNNNTEFLQPVYFSDNVTVNKTFQSNKFIDGFSGIGTQIDFNQNNITTDYLTVRKALNVYEWIINRIKATNGSLWVADSGKIKTLSKFNGLDSQKLFITRSDIIIDFYEKGWLPLEDEDKRPLTLDYYLNRSLFSWKESSIPMEQNAYNEFFYYDIDVSDISDPLFPNGKPIGEGFQNLSNEDKQDLINLILTSSWWIGTFEQEGGIDISPFWNNDILRCQNVTKNTVVFKQVIVSNIFDKNRVRLLNIENGNDLEIDDGLVRVDNATNKNRRGAIYLTSSDNNAPYIDVIDNTNYDYSRSTPVYDNYGKLIKMPLTTNNNIKIRIGRLDGLARDKDFGEMKGHGLFMNGNIFLRGRIVQVHPDSEIEDEPIPFDRGDFRIYRRVGNPELGILPIDEYYWYYDVVMFNNNQYRFNYKKNEEIVGIKAEDTVIYLDEEKTKYYLNPDYWKNITIIPDAKFFDLISDSVFFKYNQGAEIPVNPIINFNARYKGYINPIFKWSYSTDSETWVVLPEEKKDVYLLKYQFINSFPNKAIYIKCECSEAGDTSILEDIIYIYSTYDSSSIYQISLDDDLIQIPCDTEGNPLSFALGESSIVQMRVWFGGLNITKDFIYTFTQIYPDPISSTITLASDALTYELIDGVDPYYKIKVNNLNNQLGNVINSELIKFNITAKGNGLTTVNKILGIVKQIAGKDGNPAIIYKLIPNPSNINFTENNIITCNFKQIIYSDPIVEINYNDPGSNLKLYYTIPDNPNEQIEYSSAITILPKWDWIDFIGKSTFNLSKELDRQRVIINHNGSNFTQIYKQVGYAVLPVLLEDEKTNKNIPTNWTKELPDYVAGYYVWASNTYKTNPTSTTEEPDFSLVYDGSNYIKNRWSEPFKFEAVDGKGVEYVYKRSSSSYINDDISGLSAVQDDGYIPSTWTDNPSGVTNVWKYEFRSVRKKAYGLWGQFSVPNLNSSYGEQGPEGPEGPTGPPGDTGRTGPGLVYVGEWVSGYNYKSDPNIRHIVKSNSIYYLCRATHTSSSSNKPPDYYWEEFGANFESIATGLLFAEEATINILNSNNFFIQNKDGNIIGGISGNPDDTGLLHLPAIWYGGNKLDANNTIKFIENSIPKPSGEYAKFVVDTNGDLFSTNGADSFSVIDGKLKMVSNSENTIITLNEDNDSSLCFYNKSGNEKKLAILLASINDSQQSTFPSYGLQVGLDSNNVSIVKNTGIYTNLSNSRGVVGISSSSAVNGPTRSGITSRFSAAMYSTEPSSTPGSNTMYGIKYMAGITSIVENKGVTSGSQYIPSITPALLNSGGGIITLPLNSYLEKRSNNTMIGIVAYISGSTSGTIWNQWISSQYPNLSIGTQKPTGSDVSGKIIIRLNGSSFSHRDDYAIIVTPWLEGSPNSQKYVGITEKDWNFFMISIGADTISSSSNFELFIIDLRNYYL